eukprot:XP_019079575.1 PREDICTED: putative disease resistance protein At1g50180 [Vitis vinifera]
MEILLEQLMKPDKRCSVVSICGMGGLGKTTLAKKVYHHVHVRRHFDHAAWSSISQYFNVREAVQGILIQLTSADEGHKAKIRNMRDEELFESVYKIQEEKKCLVILDDMWKIGDWESLKPAFPLHKAGSKILLTTRMQAVASHADPQGFLYQPELLSEEKSWELLRTKAFPKDDGRDPTTINNWELLGKEMAKDCGGLPLAVVVLGGLLATKHHTYEWERVHKHTKSYLRKGKGKYEQQGSGVADVLALSYQDLPYQLKSCFLYLGHFPEDQEIHTKALIRMWVAEGIVSRVEEETPEDVAEGYLDELIGRCMIQVGRRGSNGRVQTCRLHDLMRDLCLSKAEEENFLEIVNLQQMETFSSSMPTTRTSNKVRRRAIFLDRCSPLESVEEARLLSVNGDEGANSYVNLIPQNGTYLRSLLTFHAQYSSIIPKVLRNTDWKNFKLLRVLSLERLPFKENNNIPEALGNLILDISYMPKEFIQRLQVINGLEGDDFYKVRHVPSVSLIVDFMISPLAKANMKRRALGGSCADIIEGWCKLQTPLGGLFLLLYVFDWSVVDSHVQRECIIGDSLLFYFYFLLLVIIECATTHVIRIMGNGGRRDPMLLSSHHSHAADTKVLQSIRCVLKDNHRLD